MKMETLYQKKVRIIVLLTIGLVLIPYAFIFYKAFSLYPYTCMDSSIILSEMERIAEGWIPYHEMHLNYPPLWFYLMALLKNIFHVPYNSYAFYLGIQYIFIAGICLVMFKIIQLQTSTKWLQWFTVLFFLFMAFWYRAFFILFEPLSILLGLLGLYFTLLSSKDHNSWNFLWIGILTACSFFVKQFGAGFILLLVLSVLMGLPSNGYRKTLSNIVFLSIGIAIPIIICLTLWGKELIYSSILNGYGTSINESIGEDISLKAKSLRMLERLFHLVILECPIAILGIISIQKADKKQWLQFWAICLAGIIGFTGQYYFCAYTNTPHYNLYMLPFICMLFPVIEIWADNRLKRIICIICVIGSMCYGISTLHHKRNKLSSSVVSENLSEIPTTDITSYIVSEDTLTIAKGMGNNMLENTNYNKKMIFL